MKVMELIENAKGFELQPSERPTPVPGPADLLLRVHAAGVIPPELEWFPTTHHKDGSPRQNAIPTHEFSGVVVACGEAIEGFNVGDAIYGMNDWFQEGALAEFCVAPATSVAIKPKSLSYVESATVPISALTAWQALTTHGNLQSRETVLIHGAAGGVGLFGVQFAKALGAHVTATASAPTIDFVKTLGADHVLDYRTSRFDQELRNIDLVVDTVGGDTLTRSWSVLSPKGRVVTAVSTIPDDAPQHVKDAFFLVQPDGPRLAKIASLIDAGKLRTFVKAVAPLQNAAQAYDRSLIPQSPYGKIVISVTA